MITKKHIRQYLGELSSGTACEQGQMPAHVWEPFHEYMINHYKLLDKEARAYADEIFDQLDGSVQQRIDSLPECREREVLSRKLSMVRGERCPIPVVYLDTPVIENIIRHALGQRLAGSAAANSKDLYEAIVAQVKDGELLCPEDSFHREALQMGGPGAREGLNIIRMLSEGLSFKHNQSIEDFQIFRALRGFIEGNGPVNYRKFWRDAFQKETVYAIMKKRSSIAFKGTLGLCPVDSRQGGPESPSTRLRIRYDEASLKDEHKLQQRSTRHLRDLVRLGMKYQSLKGEAQKPRLDGFWAGQKIDLPVALWNQYGGKPEGLEGLTSFYESKYFRDVPAIKVKQEIWRAFSDHGKGLRRATWPADVNIVSSVLPYTDIMILGRKMTDTVRDGLKLDLEFDTKIYSVDEHDLIMAALEEIACPA